MERKIYDRQVNKQGMSDRVVDELNPQNQFRRGDVDKLMSYEVFILLLSISNFNVNEKRHKMLRAFLYINWFIV